MIIFFYSEALANAAAQRLVCPCCFKVFAYTNGLALHIKAKHPITHADLYDDVTPIKANQRTSYTNYQKSRAIDKYYTLALDPKCLTPYTATVKWAFGACWRKKKGYLRRWLDACGRIRTTVKNGKGGKSARRNGVTRKPDYPDCEDELYIRFLFRRTALGYPCNHYWLQSEFKKILDEVKPPGWNITKKYSYGWAVRFCIRYSITTQAKNNIKAHDQVDRLDAIRDFHRFLIMSLQHSAPQCDPKYGRFSPDRMLHVDQVPLPFASDRGKTLNPRGAKSCRIAGVNTSGLEKRQATLQLWICAMAGHQYVKPTIIFRGGRGPRSKLPWRDEQDLYDTLTNIRVAFQDCAWADAIFCEQEIIQVARDIHAAGITGEVMIGMDNHSAQRTPAMLALYASLGLVPVFTAANCTDCISPVDHHIGRYIQTHMGRSYRKAVEDNPDIWIASTEEQEIADPACRGAKARRMLMAQWLSAAWTELTTDHAHMIDAAFVKTGFKVAKDGSEDHLIDIQGWSDPTPYTYRE
jgi:hypothetical protein